MRTKLPHVPWYLAFFSVSLGISNVELHHDFFRPADAIPVVGLVLVLSAVLLAAFSALSRKLPLSALFTLLALLALFPTTIKTAPLYALGAATGVGCACYFAFGRGTRRRLALPRAFTPIFNAAAAVAVVTVLGHAALNTASANRMAVALLRPGNGIATADVAPGIKEPLPHIIHIVVDGYSRADVLATLYDYDNTPFLDALRSRGFRVSEQATSPYNQTLFVMASVFSMDMIARTAAERGLDQTDRSLRMALAQVHREGRVVQTLKELGYELRSTPSSYPPLEWEATGEYRDGRWRAERFGPRVYLQLLLDKSPILRGLRIPLLGLRGGHAEIDRETLTRLPDRRFQPSDERHLFVYQHIVAPHPPFNIRADGSPLEIPGFSSTLVDGSSLIRYDEARRRAYRDGYVEKLKYVNDALLRHIDGLKETLAGDVVIVLQGDHGGGLYFDHYSVERTCIPERFATLFAIYATDPTWLEYFDNEINVANLYRVLLRALVGSDLPDLPSRHTFVPWNLAGPTDVQVGDLREDAACGLGGGGHWKTSASARSQHWTSNADSVALGRHAHPPR